jgi:hypothetical protein
MDMAKIVDELRALNVEYSHGLIAIGGVAVYLHAVKDGRGAFAEFTHDVDFYLSQEHLGSLRDREEVTPNPKLHKQQMMRQSIEMDIYVEHQHRLAIPHEEVDRYSSIIDGIRVAAKEHLLVLKLDAAIDRYGSGKGMKDQKDLVNIVLGLNTPRKELLAHMLDSERLAFLRETGKRSEPFQTMAGGNSHQASIMRMAFNKNLRGIERTLIPEQSQAIDIENGSTR